MSHDDGRETVTVWVVLPRAAHAAAERLAKAYADEGLEEVLAALALDLAALRAGRRGPRLSWVFGWIVCEGWPRVALGDGATGKEGA